MGTPEQFFPAGASEQPASENLDPRHLYAAYMFDDAANRRRDVAVSWVTRYATGGCLKQWSYKFVAQGMLGRELNDDEMKRVVGNLPGCLDRIVAVENEHGHLCNAVKVHEGIGEDGQMYVRRKWGLDGEPPDDFTPHGGVGLAGLSVCQSVY
jgi:hypothetical protein